MGWNGTLDGGWLDARSDSVFAAVTLLTLHTCVRVASVLVILGLHYLFLWIRLLFAVLCAQHAPSFTIFITSNERTNEWMKKKLIHSYSKAINNLTEITSMRVHIAFVCDESTQFIIQGFSTLFFSIPFFIFISQNSPDRRRLEHSS